LEPIERSRSNTDDRVGLAVDTKCGTDGVRAAVKCAPPKPLAQDCDGIRPAYAVIFRRKKTTIDRLQPEYVEEATAGATASCTLCDFAIARDFKRNGAVCGDAGKGVEIAAIVLEGRIGERTGLRAPFLLSRVEANNSSRVATRK